MLAAVAAVAVVGAAAAAPQPDTVTVRPGHPIQIAVPVALTGDHAALGESGIRAIRMAVENRAVKGFPIELNVFNAPCPGPPEEFDERAGANETVAIQIVANPQSVAVIGHTCSFSAWFALPTYEPAGIPIITAVASNPDLPTRGPTVFNRVIVEDPHTNGWYRTVTALPTDVAWQLQYEARWGQQPDYGADLHYDAANLLIDRIDAVARKHGGGLVIDRAALRTAIRQTTNFEGVSCTITLDGDGNRVNDRKTLSACGKER